MYASSYNTGGAKKMGGLPYPAPPMSIAAGQPCPSSHYSAASVVNRGTVPWSTGLCHCCDDPANCLVTAFCPCITFGQIAELVNQGKPGNYVLLTSTFCGKFISFFFTNSLFIYFQKTKRNLMYVGQFGG